VTGVQTCALPICGNCRGVDCNPAGTDIAVGHDTTSPFIAVYTWSAGFGTKYANAASVGTGLTASVDFNSLGDTIAMTNENTPYIFAYPWSAGFGTKYANPATLPTASTNGIEFN
jgi:hypothetical protein